jgi:hypothetical protein
MEKNSITIVPYALSVPSNSSRPCSVSSVSSEETINHAGGSRKNKMTLDSSEQVIMSEKRKLEVLERDLSRV